MSIGAIFDTEADAVDDKTSDTSENVGYINTESGVSGPDFDGRDDISSSKKENSDQEDQKAEDCPDSEAVANVQGALNT